jgi:hypothetical protein
LARLWLRKISSQAKAKLLALAWPGQATAFGRDFSEALALALLNPRPGQSHLNPKPEKAKVEPQSHGFLARGRTYLPVEAAEGVV